MDECLTTSQLKKQIDGWMDGWIDRWMLDRWVMDDNTQVQKADR